MPKILSRLRLPEPLMRLIYTRSLKERPCGHLHLIQVREPDTNACRDCIALGDDWIHLRMCLVCGYVGCCDMAKNKHMMKHVQETGHPLIRSIEPGEGWIWCYDDNALLSPHSPQLDEQIPVQR